MADLSEYPPKLREIVEIFADINESDRAEILLDYSDRFVEVPPDVAMRPFNEFHRVAACESAAFVFTDTIEADGTLNIYFAVENPQGVSAKALAAILQESMDGEPAESILTIPTDLVERLFGKRIAMGKGEGLLGIVSLLKYLTREELKKHADQ